mmetsp:Transcript_40804/g.135081  ORF Transcript_40804/g.135081 Transcript_40804/m.135081 type:complete len:285 (-) Transcript_40804:398-1252(-)
MRWRERTYVVSIFAAAGWPGAVKPSHSVSSTAHTLTTVPSAETVDSGGAGSRGSAGRSRRTTRSPSSYGNICFARSALAVQKAARRRRSGSLASLFLSSSFAVARRADWSICSARRSDEKEFSRACGCASSVKHSLSTREFAGKKQEGARKGPSSEERSSAAPFFTPAGRNLPLAAKAAPSGFSRTRVSSARYVGAKGLRRERLAASSASLSKSGAAKSPSVPSSCIRSTSLDKNFSGSAVDASSLRSAVSSRSTPSCSAAGGCGNMVGLSAAIAVYETHNSLT